MEHMTLGKFYRAQRWITLIVIMTGCGGPKSSENAALKVTNGLLAKEEYPEVVMLQYAKNDAISICTGTFVNQSQVITAAHCIYDLVKSKVRPSALVFGKESKDGSIVPVPAVSFVYYPDYKFSENDLNPHDLAVVTFPKNSAPAQTHLAAATPQVGTSITIVGYGLNSYSLDKFGNQQGSGAGVKRKGDNKIADIKGGMLVFFGVPSTNYRHVPGGQGAASGSGDSGGPLFVQGALAGVTAGGGLVKAVDDHGSELFLKESNYVDINDSGNREFLRRELTAGMNP